MKKVKIVIASDAHRHIEEMDKIIQKEKDGDYFWDLGDNFCYEMPTEKFLSEWTSVLGNNDFYPYPEKRDFEIFGIRIRMMHGDYLFCRYETIQEFLDYMNRENIQILLFGHTHQRLLYKKDNKMMINPGSVSRPREFEMIKKGVGTYCVLTLYEDGTTNVEFKEVSTN